jgi:two-component sensor histidine kinase
MDGVFIRRSDSHNEYNFLTRSANQLLMLACRCFRIILQLLLSIVAFHSYSQDYSFIRYDTRDGLAGSVVYDAIQDKEGFMWFATENGLSRFDGKNFKTFTTKDGLPDNEILKLFVDSKGRVWIMPFRPSVCYYYKGKIYNKDNDSLVSKISLLSHALDMAEDRSGNLFIAQMKTWLTILANGEVKTATKINGEDPAVNAIGINKNGDVELLFSLFRKPNNNVHYLIRLLDGKTTMIEYSQNWSDNSTSSIGPGYIIIPGKENVPEFIKSGTDNIIVLKAPPNSVSINYIDTSKIAINTTTGLRLFNPQTKTFSDLLFKDFSFTSGFRDKENNLWLTTSGAGVLMVPSLEFKNYSFADHTKNFEVTVLSKIRDSIYVAGWDKKIWKARIDDLVFSSFADSSHEGGKMISILSFKNRLLLSNSVFFLNPITLQRDKSSVKSVSNGKSGITYATHRYAILCKWSGELERIWDDRATCAVEKDSGFYIGTLTGLIYRPYEGKVVDLGKIFPDLSSRIANLAVSDDNILWVTTKGNGLVAYAEGKIVYHFTQAEGLTSDNCISLHVDSNAVWLGTEKGLNRIEITKKGPRITRFSMSDGLPSNVINAIETAGKKVFVGTPMGLTYFEVDKISQASSCDLQLTGVYLVNKYWTYDSTGFTLPHKNNDIRFEFSGISFKSAGEIQYQYRLLGLQSDWRTTTDEQLNFPSLSSGKYTLQLKAINKYGIESGVKEVSFTIEKLLRERTWFRILILLLLIDIIWLFFRYRIGTVRKKAKEQAMLNQRIADLEQKALRSQMNPHFIFNSLNSIQQYVAERDITGANNFITDFSRLIRMTLDLSTNTLINMSDEIEYITTYLKVEKTRLENQFDYSINIDKNLNLHEIHVPPLLLQPYVENSIRHGIKYRKENNGMISICVRRKEADILVSIEDNGIGREAAQQYKSKYHIQYQSKGMSINKDRIEILNRHNHKKIEIFINDLYDKNNEAAGTRVDIYLKQ